MNNYDKVDINKNGNIIINIKHSDTIKDNKLLPGYSEELYNVSSYDCKLCWNCSHSFMNKYTGIPLSYKEGIFTIYGYFCSFNCAARYIIDNYHHKNKWNIYSLLNLYYNMSNNTIGKIIKPSPNKLVLKNFGGNISIEEYRGNKNSYEVYIPPIIPHHHSIIHINENSNNEDNKNEFKLARSKPLNNKNNIYSIMNLS
jgi:hypothetical protein